MQFKLYEHINDQRVKFKKLKKIQQVKNILAC
jgi:hypothetical protein